jgi:S1-C subfamily serine protease
MRVLVLASVVSLLAARASAQSESMTGRLARSTVEIVVVHGAASGLVVGDEHWILTTLCSVDEALGPDAPAPIQIRFASGTRRWAHVIRFDLEHDLALLELEGEPVPVSSLALGPDARPSVGATLRAVAYQSPSTLVQGEVTGQRPGTDWHAPGTPDLILTDIPLGAGSAGRPLVDERGRVLAISVASEAPELRVGVAIPVAYARALIDGVRAARAARARHRGAPPGLEDLGVTAEDGLGAVHVLHVDPGSPADRAGIGGDDAPMRIGFLRSTIPFGCYVTALDGVPTPTVAALEAALATHARGAPIPVTIRSTALAGAATDESTVRLDRLP